MLPMNAISMLDDEEYGAPASESYEDPEPRDVGPAFNRQRLAGDFQALMGNDMDADGVAADVIDAGNEMVLWGVTPSPDSFAIVPDMGDWTDPTAWLDRLDEFDLPADLELSIERLARGAATRMDAEGEATVRTRFAQRLADLLRDAGVETLAVRNDDGFDWIVLNAQDLARETDGEPWAPPGGLVASADLREIGVSLGRGGKVRLWPTDASEPPVPPPGVASPEDGAGERAAPPPAPPPPPRPVPTGRRGGSGLIS